MVVIRVAALGAAALALVLGLSGCDQHGASIDSAATGWGRATAPHPAATASARRPERKTISRDRSPKATPRPPAAAITQVMPGPPPAAAVQVPSGPQRTTRVVRHHRRHHVKNAKLPGDSESPPSGEAAGTNPGDHHPDADTGSTPGADPDTGTTPSADPAAGSTPGDDPAAGSTPAADSTPDAGTTPDTPTTPPAHTATSPRAHSATKPGADTATPGADTATPGADTVTTPETDTATTPAADADATPDSETAGDEPWTTGCDGDAGANDDYDNANDDYDNANGNDEPWTIDCGGDNEDHALGISR